MCKQVELSAVPKFMRDLPEFVTAGTPVGVPEASSQDNADADAPKVKKDFRDLDSSRRSSGESSPRNVK